MLICHSSREAIYERVHGNRLRNIVSIREEQFVFVKGKSTTDVIFALSCKKDTEKDNKTYTVYSLI